MTIWEYVKALWEWCGSDAEALAQLAHVGWGCALALLLNAHMATPFSLSVAVGFSVLKELSEYWTETGETRGSTITDLAFWWIGILIAGLLG